VGAIEADPALGAIIDEIWGSRTGLRIAPITAGITNRNYRVDVADESFVVRVPGRDTELLGIDRPAEFEAASAAAQAGVAPPVYAFLPERRCLVTRFVDGVPVPSDDLERPEILAAVIRAIGAIHAMPPLRSTFDPWEVVADHCRVAADRGVEVPVEHVGAFEQLERIRRAFDAGGGGAVACHNDLLNANLIRAGDRIVIVDYEYAGMNDRFFDLGNFSINNGLSEEARGRLLRGYFGEVTPWHVACLALMRIVSDFREATWGLAQQGLSTLDFDYAAYTRRHFERARANAADPAFGEWLRAAADG
jgi:aminoglycoside phosphotransferase (APT) family kinase protein